MTVRSAIRPSFVLFGTIVGAGIFGLPGVVAKSGYAVGAFWMLVLAGVVTLTHLMYAEVVLATPGNMRLVGHVRQHLGVGASRVEAVASMLGLYGSCLAYLILGGLFIAQLLSVLGVSATAGSLLLAAFGILAASGGARFLSRVDFWLTLIEGSAFVLLAAVAASAIRGEHLTTGGFDLSTAILPYGIVLYAYGGLSAVSEIRDMAGGNARIVRKSVVTGTLMAAALTIAFVTAVVGATGPDTTPEAVGGLNALLGGPLPMLGAFAGFFAILTSYAVFTDYLKQQFHRDFRLPSGLAVAAAVGVPLILYLLGVRSFGKILEVVGAILIGIEGMFVAMMYLKVKRSGAPGVLRVPSGLVYLLIAAYGAGILYELAFGVFVPHA